MKKSVLTYLFCSCVCVSAVAQVTVPRPSQNESGEGLSIDEARALALEHNRAIQKSKLTLEQTGYDVKAYKANYYPKLSLTLADFYSTAKGDMTLSGGNLPIYVMNPATGTYVPNVTVNADGSYTLNQYALFPDQKIEYKVKNVFIGGIQLQQPLYTGGKITSAYRMSQLGRQMAEENITLTRAEIILRTDEAFMQAIRARELGRVARSYQTLLLELQKNVQSAVRHGLKTHNDELKVQVKLNEAELSIQRADNGYRLACMNLGQIIGATSSLYPIMPEQGLEMTGLESAVNSSVAGRPEHTLLQQKADLAAQQVKLTRSDYLPNLALMAGYSYANGGEIAGRKFVDSGSAYVGVALKWDIFNFGEQTNKVRSARARQQIAELELQDADEKMTLELQQATNNLQEAQTELRLTERALQQADENMRMSRSQYDNGLEPLSDLLEAQSLWQQASANVIEARCQLRLAYTRYLKAAGQL